MFPRGFWKWRSFLLVFHLANCNLLCLTALVSQGKEGQFVVDTTLWLAVSLHGGGTLISMFPSQHWVYRPNPGEPFPGCSICLFSFKPPSPPFKKKMKNNFFFLVLFLVLKWILFFSDPFNFIFKSAVILDIGRRDFQKIMQKTKRKRKTTEWAKDESFQNKFFFQNLLLFVFCVSVKLMNSPRLILRYFGRKLKLQKWVWLCTCFFNWLRPWKRGLVNILSVRLVELLE